MGSARTAEAAGGGGGGGGCRRRWLKKAAAAAAASDGSAVAPGRRRELPSFLGTAGVLKRKGSVRGPEAGSRGAGRVFVWLRSAPGSPSEQLQLQQQPTFPQPSETRAAASVLLFRHLPGAREPAEPPSPRCLSPLSLSAPSLPEGGAESSQERGRGWKETGCLGLRPPSQVQHQEPGGVATSAGRLPPWPWGTGFKAWEKFLHFEKEGPLAGGCRERPRGCVRLGACSGFVHLCHQVSAAELRRIRETRGADTRAHTGLPFSSLLGSPRSSGSHRPTATSSSPRTLQQDPRQGHLHLGLCTPGLPAIQPRLNPRRSSGPQLGLLDFLCRGGD